MKTMRGVERWVLSLIGAGLVALLLIGVVSYMSVTRLLEAAMQATTDQVIAGQVNQVVTLIDEATIAARGALLTRSDSFPRAYERKRDRLPFVLGDLDARIATGPERAEFDSLRTVVRAQIMLLAAQLDEAPRPITLARHQEVDDGIGRVHVAATRLILAGRESAEGRRRAALDAVDRIRVLILAVLAVAFGLGVLGARLLVRMLRDRENAIADRERIFDVSPDLICVATKEGYFRDVNRAWTMALGHTRQDLIARPFLEFVHPDDVERTIAEFSKVTTFGGRTFLFQNRYRAKDGSYHWLEWTGSHLLPDGVAYGAARDISALKAAQETLEQLSGILPICATCHKIRDEQGAWVRLETYIRDRSEADFTHTVCTTCSTAMFGS